LQQAGFKQVRQVLYPGLRHEILQEVSKQQVYEEVAAWLRALADHASNKT
jgi:alpha-beta hydrolase superfamily lysophospholipase